MIAANRYALNLLFHTLNAKGDFIIIFAIGLLLAVTMMLLLSFSDIFSKPVADRFGAFAGSLYLGVALLPAIAYLALSPPAQVTPLLVMLAVGAGVTLALGYLFVLKSLETEQATNTWGLINLGYLSIILFGVLVLGEHVTVLQAVAIAVILVGAMMVTINKGMKFNRQLFPALIGNLFWVGFNVLIIYGINAYTSSPSAIIFIVFASGFLILLFYGVVSQKIKIARKLTMRKNGKPFAMFLASGILLGAGQIAFALVILQRFVALGGAVLAMEPMVVLIAGYTMYREHITAFQGVGILITVVGAAILSLL